MNVVISPNIKKEKEMINRDGNVIDPKTKRVIKKEPAEYIPPPAHVLEAWKKEKNPETPVAGGLGEILEAVAQKRAKDLLTQIDNRTAEILKDLLK